MKKLLLNERGDAHWIVFIVGTIIVATSFSCIVLDSWFIDNFDRKTTRVIDDLNLDVYTMLDVEYTAFETGFDINAADEAKVLQKVKDGLQARFMLDSSLSPLPGSPFKGAVAIENFKVVHENDVPYNDGYGRTMEYPGISFVLVGAIKTPFLGIQGNHRILITTEVYR
jgi:hypothetical protein